MGLYDIMVCLYTYKRRAAVCVLCALIRLAMCPAVYLVYMQNPPGVIAIYALKTSKTGVYGFCRFVRVPVRLTVCNALKWLV